MNFNNLQSRMRSLVFVLFLIVAALTLSRTLITNFAPLSIVGAVLNLFAALIPVVASVCAIVYLNSPSNRMRRFHMHWLMLFGIFTFLLFCKGVFITGASVIDAGMDMAPYICFASFTIVGTKREFWSKNLNVLVGFSAFAIIVNLIAMRDTAGIVQYSNQGARATIASASYETQALFDFLPLLILTTSGLSFYAIAIVAAAVVFNVAQQFMFQKRLPMFMWAFSMGTVLISWLWSGRRGLVSKHKYFVGLLGAVGVLAGVALAIRSPEMVRENLSDYLSRWSGVEAQGKIKYSSGGAAAFLSLENERVAIVVDCFSAFSFSDWATGLGMGGAYESNSASVSRGDIETMEKLWLDDLGIFGRRSFEIGILMPVMKGGVLYWLVLYSIYFAAFFMRRNKLTSELDLGVFLCLAVLVVQTFMGGEYVLGTTLRTCLTGLCVGWLMREADVRLLPHSHRTQSK